MSKKVIVHRNRMQNHSGKEVQAGIAPNERYNYTNVAKPSDENVVEARIWGEEHQQ